MPDLEAFFARVDAEIATLSDEDARDFLDRLSAQWVSRYEQFQYRVSLGQPVAGDAFDYTQTIAGIDQRLAKYNAAELAKWHAAYRKSDAYRARSVEAEAA